MKRPSALSCFWFSCWRPARYRQLPLRRKLNRRKASRQPPAPEQPDVGAALQGLLDDQVQEQGILGMAMAVRLPDGTVVFRSSGSTDPAGKHAWSLDTVSALGSITKSFTAVVIMQLVEEGKLSLDDTIDAWFPDQPNADKITVRMLLSHTSGLANYISAENELEPKWAHEWAPLDLVAEANRLGPVDEPGSSVAHYSNTNYILLGLIIEAITGNSWDQEVRSRIIEPLDLEHTTFLGEEGVWGGTMVAGYFKTADGYISTLELPSYPHASTSWAAGEVVSTACGPADLCQRSLRRRTRIERDAGRDGDAAGNGRRKWGRLGPRRRNDRERCRAASAWKVAFRAIAPSSWVSRTPSSTGVALYRETSRPVRLPQLR